ncbi:ATP-binding protein [Methanolobus sp. ZRKC2]|uniref:ATP-binding protein n=1 Tax=Methanolobus sp. ZRKC2 TaxID=3125783 RepID=UPI003244B81E
MKIAIASGKGGTGKTTVAVNLALSLNEAKLADCDVEEPNCNIFLRSCLENYQDVVIPVPEIDETKCIQCGKCAQFCQYNAIAILSSGPMLFPKLCHGCGGCIIVCPEDAINEFRRTIGVVERSKADFDIDLWQGRLFTAEPMASPVIKCLKGNIGGDGITIIDSPPGTACPVIASITDVDHCVLVTEPTPFGLNDLILAVGLVRQLEIPFGIVINRAGVGDELIENYCRSEKIPILMKIPDEGQIAVLYSEGVPFVTQMPEWKERFLLMFGDICRQVSDSMEG